MSDSLGMRKTKIIGDQEMKNKFSGGIVVARKNTRATLFAAIVVVLSVSIFASLTPATYAAQVANEQKGLTVLNNVLGLDTAKYAITSKQFSQNQSTLSSVVSPLNNVGYSLISNGSFLNILCTFANGKLQMLQVLQNTGVPVLTDNAANPASGAGELAKSFLGNYQLFSSSSLYGTLKSTLDVVDASKNTTATFANAQLQVSAINGYTAFRWESLTNGILAPSRFVGLGFANGSLTYFVDNWQFYQIGNSNVKVSETEAKTISIQTAKTHPWSLNIETNSLDGENLNQSNVAWASLVFDNSCGADTIRDDNASVLYPVWRVGVSLNKWYGNLYGIEVDVWADTGQIRSVKEAWSTITPQEESAMGSYALASASTSSINDNFMLMNNEATQNTFAGLSFIFTIASVVISCISASLALIITNKRKDSRFIKWRRSFSNFLRISNIPALKPKHGPQVISLTLLTVLLFSMVSILLFNSVPTAKATTPTSHVALIWGSESKAAYNYTEETSWRKSNIEVANQSQTAQMLAYMFNLGGYNGYDGQNTSINQQGSTNDGSYKSSILSQLSSLKTAGTTHVAIVDFDHGVGDAPNPSANDQMYFNYTSENTSRFDFSEQSDIPYNEWHYHFEDQNGLFIGGYEYTSNVSVANAVYDTEIYNLTLPEEVSFAFINACLSANYTDTQTVYTIPYPDGPQYNFTEPNVPLSINAPYQPVHQGPIPGTDRIEGMPYAFTHKYVGANSTIQPDGYMSGDGYLYPDGGSKVYIGFPYGSAALSQMLPNWQNGSVSYATWVQDFFYAALNTQYPETVNQALDYASLNTEGWYFGISKLHTGFDAYWWYYFERSPMSHCTMAIYGNGDIYIQNPPPSGAAPLPTPSLRSVTSPYAHPNDLVTFGAVTTDISGPSYYLYYTFDWGDDTPRNTIGLYASGTEATISHSYDLPGQYQVRVCAIDTLAGQTGGGNISEWSSPIIVTIQNGPLEYPITASNNSYSYIIPSGMHNYAAGSNQTFYYGAYQGSTVRNVTVDGTAVTINGSYQFTNIVDSHQISVEAFPNSYIISAQNDSHSSINPSGQVNVTYGASQNFTYSAESGYTITNVLVDGTPVAITGSYLFPRVTASHNITVSSATNALDHFTISAPASATAGSSFGSVTVAAYDSQNQVITGYTGAVYFTSSDPQATIPYTVSNKYTFTGGDAGQHTFTGFNLKTAGNQGIIVRDGSHQASSTIAVSAASLNSLIVNPSSNQIVESTQANYTAAGYDAYGNSKGDYTGQASWGITAGAGGSWNGATYTSQNVGTWTVTASYGGIQGTATLIVNSGGGQVYTLSVDNLNITYGQTATFTVTPTPSVDWTLHQFGSCVGDFSVSAGTGTFQFGPLASLYWINFSPLSFYATVGTFDTNTVQVYVNLGDLNRITASLDSSSIATGSTTTAHAYAYDSQGGYMGEVAATWSIQPGAGGSWYYNSYTSQNAGTWTVTATYEGLQATTNLTVTSGSISRISVSPGSGSVTAGDTKAYTATAYDSQDNNLGVVSAIWSIQAGAGGSWDGATYTSEYAGVWTVTAIYEGKQATVHLTVNPGALDYIAVAPASADITVGSQQTYQATAYDTYGNNVGLITNSASWNISSGAGGSWTGSTYTSQNAGTWTVTASYLGETANSSLNVNSDSPVIFQDGFESGSFSAWGYSGGSVTSSPVHGGSYAANASGSNVYWEKQLNQSYDDLFFAGYVRLPSLPSSGEEAVLFAVWDSTWTYGLYGSCGVDVGGSYWMLHCANTNKTYVSIPTDTWVFVEMEYNTNGTGCLWVNGDLLVTLTGQQFTNGVRYVQGGNPSGITPAGFMSFGDDYMAATTYIAPQQTFTITASAGDGGSISPSGSVPVSIGGSQTFTITADSNYSIFQVTVDGENLGATGSYTFTNVHSSHTISVSFTSVSPVVFQDGFESGNFSGWYEAGGAVAIVSSPVHSGSYSASSANSPSYWAKNLGGGFSDLFFAGYVLIPSNLSANQCTLFLTTYDSSYSYAVSAGLARDGDGNDYWILRVNGNWYGTVATVQTNTWYFLETEYNKDGTARLWVNGNLIDTATGQTLAGDPQIIQAGTPYSYAPSGFVSFGDDYAAATNYIGAQQTFTITASAGDGGSISPSGSIQVSYGNSQTFNITSNPGYYISEVLVDSISQGAISNYTFSNVASSHTISASFASNIVFEDGFESGSFGAWGYSGGSVTSSPIYSGSYAANATGSNVYWEKQLNQSYNDIFFAGYIRLPSLPSSGQEAVLFAVWDSTWNYGLYGSCGVDGGGSYWMLHCANTNKTYVSIPTDTWVFVEMEYNTNGTGCLWVNGDLLVTLTGQQFTNGVRYVQGGNPSAITPAGFMSFGDDYMAATSYISP